MKTMPLLDLDPNATALILVDLQNGIVARQTAPYSAADVLSNGAKLAAALREKGATVVYLRVDPANMLQLPVDVSFRDPNAPPPPANFSELAPEAGVQPGDLVINKRHWGGFYGTDLERQLRGRGIRTVVLGGIATNFGVESTARSSAGLGFETVLVEDAMTSLDAEMHRFAMEKIFPRLGRVRSTKDVIASLG